MTATPRPGWRSTWRWTSPAIAASPQEAAALFAQAPGHRLALLGRAELALAAGNAASARDLVDQYLRRFPRQTVTERIVGLELAVRAAVAAGNLAAAAESLAELAADAAVAGTPALRATALFARGINARAGGDPVQARTTLEDAADLFDGSGIPFEGARARLELARTLVALGRDGEALVQARKVRETCARLGAAVEAETAASLEAEIAARSRRAGAAAAGRLTARELDVVRLIAAGRADREIAANLRLSRHTVHRHVSNILTKLDLSSRAAVVAYASRRGLL